MKDHSVTICVCDNCSAQRFIDRIEKDEYVKHFEFCPECRKEHRMCKQCGFTVYFEPYAKNKGEEYKCTSCGRLN